MQHCHSLLRWQDGALPDEWAWWYAIDGDKILTRKQKALAWSQMDDDWIFFEAEVEPDAPIMSGQRGIVITKSLVKVSLCLPVKFPVYFTPSLIFR